MTKRVRAARVLSGLAALFLAVDAGGKLLAPNLMIANSPPLGFTLFGVYIGVILWTGLWLRESHVRALLPLIA